MAVARQRVAEARQQSLGNYRTWRVGGGGWLVTYAGKTMFTPAGVSVYTRRKEGLPVEMIKEMQQALMDMQTGELTALAESLFSVQHE